ncbi:MAG: adenine phosphoribosyltransferase [Myxococcales bacterium]|nr:adenine phosphoribosyltransferase [Myxococcales bacterium]
MADGTIETLRSHVRDVPNFPKPGITFKDITPLLADPPALRGAIDLLAAPFRDARPDVVVGIESRGFIFGAALAIELGAGFVPVRKPGKLPHVTERAEYELEYGRDAVEIHKDAFVRGARVLVVDDVIATGGTAKAACDLVARLGGDTIGAAFLIELPVLAGRARLEPVPVVSVLQY